jgi:vitamin B12 transporter
MVVTPTRTSRTVDSSLSSVTVIDDQEMRRQSPTEMSELLRAQPGVDVTSNGSYGKTTSVFMRGTGAESTMLMIDGVRLRSATAGSPAWQFLPPALIERVEIVRGPRGSLYGSDAVGGVVQMFTEPEEASGGWMEAGGGSFNTSEIGAGFSSMEDGTKLHLGFDRFRTGGTELREDGNDLGYDNTAAKGGISHEFDNGAQLGINGLRADGTTEFIGGRTDYLIQTGAARARLPVTSWWDTHLQVSEARDESTNFRGGAPSVFDTKSRMANWRNVMILGDHEIVAGADLRRDEVESTSNFEETERDNAAGFLQVLFNLGALDIQASARHDDNDAFGNETTGSVAFGYELDPNHRLRASYGTAFRAPTFNDLYFPGFGNENLDPESSATGELGARGQYQQWFWDVAAFQTDVEDLIATENRGGVFAPYNVNEARIRGVELASGLETAHWKLKASVTAQDPRNKEPDNVLRRRARQSARLEIDREFNRLSLGASGVFQSERYNDAANDLKLPGFGLLHLRAGWSFSDQWSARITVKNALDKRYTTAHKSPSFGNPAEYDYINAGRAANLSIRYGAR